MPAVSLGGQLAAAYTPLSAQLNRLITREDADAQERRTQAGDTRDSITWLIGLTMALVVLGSIGIAWLGIVRVRLALRPEANQTEFADTMQLAEDEHEAHELLQRHLERAVPGGLVTVFNRNNSADRLEAVTTLQ